MFLNTSIHGWGKAFARKLHIWLNYVVTNFPDAVLVGRMEDDVFTCTPQIFDRLHDVKHELLYYGYPTGYPRACSKDCVDEMFLIIGTDWPDELRAGNSVRILKYRKLAVYMTEMGATSSGIG